MSDDTTDTHVDNAEPSMEDILASIRRIIADEDGSMAANESLAIEEPSAPAEAFSIIEASDQDSSDKELEIVDLQENDDILSLVEEHNPSVEEDVVSDIDMLLSDLDDSEAIDAPDLVEISDDQATKETVGKATKLTGLSAIAAAGLGAVASAGAATAKNVTGLRKNPSPQSTLEALGDDVGSKSLDLLIDKDENHNIADSADTGSLESGDFLQIPDSDAPEAKDDIEALLGNLFDDNSVSKEPELAMNELDTGPVADVFEGEGDDISDELLAGLLDEEELGDIEIPVPPQSTDELDLVKSLMADLTSDPFDGGDESADVKSGETELVDDILSLSMEDEIALQPEADAQSADTQTSNAYVIDINDDLSSGHNVVETAAPLAEQPQVSSLAEIAQEAEADAKRIEQGQSFAATGFATGAGMVVATAGPAAVMVRGDSTKTDMPEADDNIDTNQEVDDILAALGSPSIDQPVDEEAIEADDASQIEPETTTSEEILPPQETADMPKAAAKKDAIINEVTEEATAGAFASLNQIVETNADVQERGDRIGDLVQEALRPMLKEWLDKNLKGIVERAVTKEVKRISSGK